MRIMSSQNRRSPCCERESEFPPVFMNNHQQTGSTLKTTNYAKPGSAYKNRVFKQNPVYFGFQA